MLSDMVRDLPGGLILKGTLLVLGNVLIVGLEGLIVFIQTLRLEYYEFLGNSTVVAAKPSGQLLLRGRCHFANQGQLSNRLNEGECSDVRPFGVGFSLYCNRLFGSLLE